MDASIPCPRCGRAVRLDAARRPPTAPFCSRRCRLADLGAWCAGDYVIGRELGPEDLEDAGPGSGDAA